MSNAETVPAVRGPPDPGDAEAWRRVTRMGQLGAHPPGAVVAALRALLPTGEAELRRDLMLFLSGLIHRLLRRKVKRSFPNEGHDIIDDAHARLCCALLDPASPDCADMVLYFEQRIHFRMIDAIKRHQRRARVELPLLAGDDGEVRDPDTGAQAGFGTIEVGQALALIADPRKRLAFSLLMDRHPKGDIARHLRVDPKTLYRWIEEVRHLLRAELNL